MPFREVFKMAKKGVPKKDSSGKGDRKNRGRSGCKPTRKTGKGTNRRTPRKRRKR